MRTKWHRTVAWIVVWTVLLGAVHLQQAQPVSAAFTYAQGDGTAQNPYIIVDAQGLDHVRNDMAAHYRLGAHIGLTSYDTGFAEGWLPIGADPQDMRALNPPAFTGSFDGAGYRISGLFMNYPEALHIGLFGVVRDATIKNVALHDVAITGGAYVGGLVGQFTVLTGGSGLIDNSYVTGTVTTPTNNSQTGYYYGSAGGLVGYNEARIMNSHASVELSGRNELGGLVGDNKGKIERSYATGNVTGRWQVGGLTGSSNGWGRPANAVYMENVFATGAVSGNGNLGGLVGANYEGSAIRTAYAAGGVSPRPGVTGSNMGGLVGYEFEPDQPPANPGIVEHAYWNSDSGAPDNGLGVPLSSQSLQQRASYGSDWDFNTTWGIQEGGSYPYLAPWFGLKSASVSASDDRMDVVALARFGVANEPIVFKYQFVNSQTQAVLFEDSHTETASGYNEEYTFGIPVQTVPLGSHQFRIWAEAPSGVPSLETGTETVVITDTTLPVAGGGGAIEAEPTHNTIALSWGAATDNRTSASDMTYQVLYGTSPDVANSGTIGLDQTANTTSYTLSGLSPNTTYYYNVIARDEGGNQVGYTEGTATTDPLVYSIQTVNDYTFPDLTIGYADGSQHEREIDIVRSGNADLNQLTVALSGSQIHAFVIKQQPLSTLNDSVSATSFILAAVDQLPAGTYTATVTITADQMADRTFTVTQIVNLPGVPARPDALTATAADAYIVLNWLPAASADYYEVYMSTVSGQYTAASATVTGTTYTINQLTNGTPYYFVVRAGNLGGLGNASDEATATPAKLPAAPTGLQAVAGDRRVTIHFQPPTDNGGSAIIRYEALDAGSQVVATSTQSPIVISSLLNGVAYTFEVRAVNAAGNGPSSLPSAPVTPVAPPSGGSGGGGGNEGTPDPATPPADAEEESPTSGETPVVGETVTTEVDGRQTVTITVDPQQVVPLIQPGGVITLAGGSGDVVTTVWDGETIAQLAAQEAAIQIETDRATYNLPVHLIDMASLRSQWGEAAELRDIQIRVEIAVPPEAASRALAEAANAGQFEIIVPPIAFTVTAAYGGQTSQIATFNGYVERLISLPPGRGSGETVTGIVLEADGTFRPVPTQIVQTPDGYVAKVSSLSNSVYAVVQFKSNFPDVTNHWSRAVVDQMGARGIVTGAEDGGFHPDRAITRAEFAAIVVRGLGLADTGASDVFGDVNAAAWFHRPVHTAYAYELVSGVQAGEFRPDSAITREAAVVIIARAMGITGMADGGHIPTFEEVGAPYADAAEVSVWAQSGMAAAVHAGIVTGRSASALAPKAFITRAEAVKMLERLLTLSNLI